MALHPRDVDSSPPDPSANDQHKDRGLGGGTMAGVAVGIIAGALLGAGLAFWYPRRKRQAPNPSEEHALADVAEKRSDEGSKGGTGRAAEVGGVGAC